MKKLKMARGVTLTLEEGCNKYLENCRQRNLREGTIDHYRQSYLYFYKFFDPIFVQSITHFSYNYYTKFAFFTTNHSLHILTFYSHSVIIEWCIIQNEDFYIFSETEDILWKEKN